MSIPYNTPATLEYTGNSTANVFSITFPTFEDSNIEASVADADGVTTDLDVNTDFTLANIGLANTNGSLTLVDASQDWIDSGNLKTGYTLFIKFNAVAYQPAKLRDLGRFAIENLEKSIDRLTMNVLAVNDKADKAVTLQLGDTGDGAIPPLAGNASRILQVKSDASGFEYGMTTAEITQARDDAQTAATSATTSKNAAATSATAAASSATAAASSATAAGISAAGADTAKTAAQTAQAGAGASESAAATSATNAASSASAAATSATAAAASAAAATSATNAATSATNAATSAATSATNAATSATNAATSATNAASSATAANTAKVAAQSAQTAAETARDAADGFKDDSEEAAVQSELYSGRTLYDNIINLDVTDSPFTIDEDLHQNTLFIVDDSGGDVDMILPLIADTTDHTNWKVGIVKASLTGNQVNIAPTGGDTINLGGAGAIVDPQMGMLFYAETPTDWQGLYFMNAAIAADALPTGGIAGDVLVKNSSLNSDATWRPDQSIINALIFG